MGMAGLRKSKVVVVAPNFLILKSCSTLLFVTLLNDISRSGHVLPSKSVRWMGIDEWTRGDNSVGAGEPLSSFDGVLCVMCVCVCVYMCVCIYLCVCVCVCCVVLFVMCCL